jgi:4-hydroxy-tetrahydrodipicolinate synthase
MVTNPIPVKTALSVMKKCREEFRLPLTPMDDNKKRELESVLSEFKMI